MKVLIGASGFVGQNLTSQIHFDAHYSSKNIHEIFGKSFQEIYCSAAPGTKWLANQDPDSDKGSISSLFAALMSVRAEHFTLISTVDVYGEVDSGKTEADDIKASSQSPYGKHRWELEEFVRNRFRSTIIRLPPLFGLGLKKNVLFDLIHKQRLDKLDCNQILQWYPLSRLGEDIRTCHNNEIACANLISAPIAVNEIVDMFFPDVIKTDQREPKVLYNVKTNFAAFFGNDAPYTLSQPRLINEMRLFLEGLNIPVSKPL